MLSKLLPAGRYYVGDPCYVISDDDWMDLLEASDYFRVPYTEFKGGHVFAGPTKFGDGEYEGFGVDSGNLGIVSESLVSDLDGARSLGRIVEFETEFKVSVNDGFFNFGDKVTIDTGAEDPYDYENELCWGAGDLDDEEEFI